MTRRDLLTGLTLTSAGFAQQPGVSVHVMKQDIQPNSVWYRYRVVNRSGFGMISFAIGVGTKDTDYELTVLPFGTKPGPSPTIPETSLRMPAGWKATLRRTSETELYSIDWETSNGRVIPSGSETDAFAVRVPKAMSPAYERSHWHVLFANARSVDGVLAPE